MNKYNTEDSRCRTAGSAATQQRIEKYIGPKFATGVSASSAIDAAVLKGVNADGK